MAFCASSVSRPKGRLAQRRAPAKDSSSFFPIIRSSILFFQGTKFPGKLFVTAFGLDREHTSWPIHQTFIPFLDLTLQTARAEDPTPTSFEPGEIAMIQLPTGS